MIARGQNSPIVAPPGGIRLGGRTFKEGQRIPKKYQKTQPERQQDPANGVPHGVPNFGRSILPSIYTFGSRISTISHVYLNPDNAMRDNIQNARFMRNDCAVMECLEARQRGVALLNWHLEPEDKDDPKQKELTANLTEILKRTPRFTEYRRNLLEAVWYGRYAVQHLYGWASVRGERRRVITAWEPINGDKLAFRYDDGSGRHREGDLGIRIGLTYLRGDVFGGRKVESTGEYGMAYFLEDWERRFVAVHKHMIEDGWFEDPQSAGRKHGVGVRDRIYWCWLLKQETSAALMEVIERTGTGFTIYRYPHGNPAAKAEMEELGKNQTRTNVIVMPAMPGDPSMDAFAIERIEPSTAGIETMKSVIHEFFGHQIKRYILGQTLSTEAASTGLGSGVADLHQDTGLQVIAYDAANLEETITNETLDPLKELNFPWARDVRVMFKIDTKDSESDRKLAAFRSAWDMGAKLKAADVMDVIGASMPTDDDETLYNPQIVGAIQQMEQGGGIHPGQPGEPQDQNAHDFGPLMQLLGNGGGGEGEADAGGLPPDGDGGQPPQPNRPHGPRQYVKDAKGHEHAPAGTPEGGQFVSDSEHTYWRIHPGEFTDDDVHDQHESKLWINGQDDEDTTGKGLSTTKTLDDLASYFAGWPHLGNSPGRSAFMKGTHLVQLKGSPTGDTPYEQDEGERLIHPSHVIASVPTKDSGFLDLVKDKINERFDKLPSEEFHYNSESDEWDKIPKGTAEWNDDERQAYIEWFDANPSNIRKGIEGTVEKLKGTGDVIDWSELLEEFKEEYPDLIDRLISLADVSASSQKHYAKDAHGHEHKGKGPGGGQFTATSSESVNPVVSAFSRLPGHFDAHSDMKAIATLRKEFDGDDSEFEKHLMQAYRDGILTLEPAHGKDADDDVRKGGVKVGNDSMVWAMKGRNYKEQNQ